MDERQSSDAKAADLTLILPPMWDVTRPWIAMSCLYEYMQSLGYRVQFLDYNIQLYQQCKEFGCGDFWSDPRFHEVWNSGDINFLSHLLDLDEIRADIIGISVECTNLAFAIGLAKTLRDLFPKKRIILGGHELFLPEDVARVPLECADAICKGEGEHTLRDVIERGFDRLEEVPGLYLPSESGWKLTAERDLIKDLDSLPWLRYGEVNLARFERRFLPLMGSRGCINQCNYCYDRYMNRGCFRTRSAKHQVDELEYLSAHFDIEHFPYNDSVLNGNVRVLGEKTDDIIRRGLKIQYGGNMMIREGMDRDLFTKLRQSGMTVTLIGVESGSAHTLHAMRKRHTPEMAAEFIRQCHDAGIRTELNFIVGFPTETEEHFQETLEFLRNNRKNIDTVISAFTFHVLPSELGDHVADFGITMGEQNPRVTWRNADGSNTHEVRIDRFNRFMQTAGDLGLIRDDSMTDRSGQTYEYPVLMDKLVLAYLKYWKEQSRSEPARRQQAIQAVRPWMKMRRNRKIAQALDRFGLLAAAKAILRR